MDARHGTATRGTSVNSLSKATGGILTLSVHQTLPAHQRTRLNTETASGQACETMLQGVYRPPG